MTANELASAQSFAEERAQECGHIYPAMAAQYRRAAHAIRCLRLALPVLEMGELAFDKNDFTRDGGVELPETFEEQLRDALAIYRRGPKTGGGK